MKKQIRMSMNRLAAGFLVGVLAVGMASGCSKKAKADVGRYVEEEIALPEGSKRPLYAKLDKDGNLVYYTSQNGTVIKNIRKQSGDVDSEEVAWLGKITANGGNILSYSENEDGTAYALYGDSSGKTELSRSKNGVDMETVAVSELESEGESSNGTNGGVGVSIEDEKKIERKLDEPTEDEIGGGTRQMEPSDDNGSVAEGPGTDGVSVSGQQQKSEVTKNGENGPVTRTFRGGQMMAIGVHALEDGFILDYGKDGVYQYDGNGTLIRKYSESGGGEAKMTMKMGNSSQAAVYGDVLAILNSDKGEIQLYDLGTGNVTETITHTDLEDETYMGVDKDGVFIGDSSGITRWVKGSPESVVDGGLTSLILPNLTIDCLLRNENGDYYAFLGDMEDTKLYRYTYDESVPKEPDTVLEVFSLTDNATIRLAIGEFQRSNPNVKVNLTVGMEEDGSATAEDVIRALNTEIIAGKGPDLLVLDGLPIDSYIEKGVLKDVTAMKDRLVTNEGLMQNLTEAYEEDGKTYGLPSRFVMPVIMGDEGLVSSVSSLAELVDAVKSRQSKDHAVLRAPDGLWEDGGLIMEYYEACVNDWMKEDGTVDEERLTEFYQQMLTLDQLLKEITPETSNMSRVGILSMGGGGSESVNFGSNDVKDNKAMVHIEKLIGIGGFMNIVSNLGEVSGMDLTSLFGKNQYYPQGGVGILAAGKQQELAESFMELVLTETVQDQYLYDGFPVNGNSLKKMVDNMLEDMKERKQVDTSEDMGFLNLCNGLADAVLIDQVVRDKVESQVEGLISGLVTPEEAAAKVTEETRLYLME